MNFTMSKRSWGLLAALFLLNLAVLSGTVTGVIPDLLRMLAAIGAIISIGMDWRQSRLG
jgi:sorbitol-specific phosphotransferase system component IIC